MNVNGLTGADFDKFLMEVKTYIDEEKPLFFSQPRIEGTSWRTYKNLENSTDIIKIGIINHQRFIEVNGREYIEVD